MLSGEGDPKSRCPSELVAVVVVDVVVAQVVLGIGNGAVSDEVVIGSSTQSCLEIIDTASAQIEIMSTCLL